MVTVYGSMDEDIRAFGAYRLIGRRLIPAPDITDITCYDHFHFHLHHYIKAQSYKYRKSWYVENGIEQKLILMPSLMHEHLESPVYGLSENDFYRRWGVSKQFLLFDKRKWIEDQVKGENYGTFET